MKTVAPRLLFAGALAGLGWIALNSPAWAEALKLQGYYTNFSLQLQVEPQEIVAGRMYPFGLRYSIASLESELVERVELILREDEGLHLLAEGACNRTSPQALRCGPWTMFPGDSVSQFPLPLLSNPDARGIRLLSGYVLGSNGPAADDLRLNVDATWVRVVGEFNSGMRLLSDTPTHLVDGYLRWTYELDNHGPSSLINAFVGLSSNHPYRTSCRSYGAASCPPADGSVYLQPGSRIEVDVDVPASALDAGGIMFTAATFSAEGTQIGTRPQYVSVFYSASIFQGGFEN